jgi:hypothetical protein
MVSNVSTQCIQFLRCSDSEVVPAWARPPTRIKKFVWLLQFAIHSVAYQSKKLPATAAFKVPQTLVQEFVTEAWLTIVRLSDPLAEGNLHNSSVIGTRHSRGPRCIAPIGPLLKVALLPVQLPRWNMGLTLPTWQIQPLYEPLLVFRAGTD